MAHLHEKIDFVANVFIVNGDAVLLRKHDKSGMWLPPGGHIELDEEPQEAAVREAKEEVGLDVKLVSAFPVDESRKDYMGTEARDLTMPFFMNRHRINETHEHISFEFFGTADTRDIFEGVERERSERIKWFTLEEIDDPTYGILEQIKPYAKRALEVLAS